MNKSGRVLSGAIAVALLTSITSQSPLFANSVARPTASPTPETFKSSLDQFKFAREIYMEELRIRSQQIKLINIAFRNAIDKSSIDYRNAMALAKNLDQRTLVASQRKSAVAAAIFARDEAIAALGAEPTPPPEPQKMKKAPGKSKNR